MTAVVVFLLFVGVQVAASLLAIIVSHPDALLSGTSLSQLKPTPEALGLSLFMAEGLLAVALGLWYYKLVPRLQAVGMAKKPLGAEPIVKGHPSIGRVLTGVLSVVLLSLGLSLLLEPLHLSDEGSNDIFVSMLHHPLCLLQLCVVGPLAEELVFRVGIVRSLHHRGLSVMTASAIGALAFALVHGNPAQSVPAFVVGILLGRLYLCVDGLSICLPAHVANNVLAVVLLLVLSAIDLAEAWPVFALVAVGLLLSGCGLYSAHRTIHSTKN